MTNKKILILTGPEGHLSIARSIEQTLAKTHQVVLQEIDEPLFRLYKPIYQLFPGFFSIPFKLSAGRLISNIGKQINQRRYYQKIQRLIQDLQPNLVASTYFMFNPSLKAVLNKKQIPFITVMTDSWSLHPFLVTREATRHILFDQKALQTALKIDHRANYSALGWFVRDEFEQDYALTEVRQQLQLQPNIFTILVTAGSEGSATVLKIMPSLIKSTQPLQVIVACGNNEFLLAKVKAMAKSAAANAQTVITALPFAPNLHLYMQAADLVVGKAGPNTVFESVATHTPFFAITHISGQEDGNLDLIKHYQIGYVEENAPKAARLLAEIIQSPTTLKKFTQPLAELANYNRAAKTKLLQLVNELL